MAADTGMEESKRTHVPTASHSEAQILMECINLMHGLEEEFRRYMHFIGFKPRNEEEEFHTSRSYFEIVKQLFLWHTTHSGGTSTCEKCRELGLDPFETIDFGFDYDPDYDPWE